MKFLVSLVHLIFLAIFISCNSPIDYMNKTFKKVNENFDKANEVTIKSIEKEYDYIISQKENHPDLALLADTLYIASMRAYEYVTSLQKVLQKADSTGNSLSPANNMVGKTPYGDTLSYVLLQVYKSVIACPVRNEKKFTIALLLKDIKSFGTDPDRKKTYFRFTTTTVAINFLGLLKSNVLTGTHWVMTDVADMTEK